MTAQGGFGLQLKIGGTAIVDLLEGSEIPEFEKIIAEMTSHSATSGYATHVATGKRKLNEFKAVLGWDSDAATHAAVVAAFDSDAAVAMIAITPGSDETIAFSAHITKIGRISAQEDEYKAEVTIQPTGAPTIT